jgi:ankyrin repeat protein
VASNENNDDDSKLKTNEKQSSSKKRFLGIFPRKPKPENDGETTTAIADQEASPNNDGPKRKTKNKEGQDTTGEAEDDSSSSKKKKRWLGIFPKTQNPAQDQSEQQGGSKKTKSKKDDAPGDGQDDDEKPKSFSLGGTVRSTAAYNKVRDFQDARKKTKAKDGDPRLHHACQEGNLERLKYLIQVKQCDVNGLYQHHTPLQTAIKEEQLEIVRFLVTEHNVSISDWFNGGAFLTACECGNKAIVKFLATKRPESGRVDHGIFQKSALLLASEKGHTDVVLYLIKRCHVDVDAVDTYGSTPLHGACANGHTDVVKCLMDKGKANPNLQTFQTGDTPLHRAAVFGHTECVQVILEKYPHLLHERNNELHTPLDLARQHGHKELVAVLVQKAALIPDPNAEMLSIQNENKEEAKVSLDQEPAENLVYRPQQSQTIASIPSLVPIQKNKDATASTRQPTAALVSPASASVPATAVSTPRTTVMKINEEDFTTQFKTAVTKSGLSRRIRDMESQLKLNDKSYESLNERVERIEDELEIFRLHWLDSNAKNAAPPSESESGSSSSSSDNDDNHSKTNGADHNDTYERVEKLETENKLLWDRLLYMETEIMEQRNQAAGFAKV